MISSILIIIICSFVNLSIIKFSYKIGFVDMPSIRKIHKGPVAFTGGLILAINFFIIILLIDYENKILNNVIYFSILLAFLGIVDDKYIIKPILKLILQLFPICLVIYFGVFLEDLGNYKYFDKINLFIFGKFFSLLCCFLLINASNYSDGIDSLLSLISVTILIYFALLSYNLNKLDLFAFILYLSIPLLVHSIFNLGIIKNFKVFLGNSGSNMIGFILAFLTIYLYKFENIHPSLLIWPLAYLVYEFLTVNILRIINKKKIFQAGHDHLHYELKKKFNISNIQILIILLILNILLMTFGYLINLYFIPDVSLFCFVIFFLIYFFISFKINRLNKSYL